MIEIVAIDNRTAESELLRLAADFALGRLFLPKQQKKLRVTFEVTGVEQAQPITRAQLAAKPGLFKAARFHYDGRLSVMHGFDVALSQLMHEMVHISQVVNGRYQLVAKTRKIEGEKHKIYRARWQGKKAGVIDDVPWQERPWEQEASTVGAQLAQEFMHVIYGQQNNFEAQGTKKTLRLYPLVLSIPQAVSATADATPVPEPVIPDTVMPEPEMPEPEMHEPFFGSPAADMPLDNTAVQSDDVFADIDAILAAETGTTDPADPPFAAPPSFDDAPAGGEKPTYVMGVAEPRMLKLSILEAKKRELKARGLLEK